MGLVDVTGRPVGKEADMIVRMTRENQVLLAQRAQLVQKVEALIHDRGGLMQFLGAVVGRYGETDVQTGDISLSVDLQDAERVAGKRIRIDSDENGGRTFVIEAAPPEEPKAE